MAPDQLEDILGAAQRMQPDPAGTGGRREGQLGPIAELLFSRLDLRIRQIQSSQAPERVAHETTAGGELGPGREVLQLTPAAGITGVVRTGRCDPLRPWFKDLIEPSADESTGGAQLFESDCIARGGSGHECDASIGQATYAVATGGDTFDADRFHEGRGRLLERVEPRLPEPCAAGRRFAVRHQRAAAMAILGFSKRDGDSEIEVERRIRGVREEI
jgi:hypothetical protein